VFVITSEDSMTFWAPSTVMPAVAAAVARSILKLKSVVG